MVAQNATGLWDFECPVTRCGFTSSGWESKKKAQERGKMHQEEHDSQEPMQELAAYEGRGSN